MKEAKLTKGPTGKGTQNCREELLFANVTKVALEE